MAAHQNGSEANHSQSLKHGLKSRHLTMISIAGVIGGSLFVGSGSIIYNTGPVVFLTYALGGLLVWFIMRMLGEMAVLNPDSGSFSTYADRAIGRWAGFSIGWLYWCTLAMLMGWEAYVAGKILNNWFPFIPIWVYMTVVIGALVAVNLQNVKNYGEFEFWFALIKVIAIVIFLVIGSLAIMHLWPWGNPAASGISNLTSQGFMPNGGSSVITALLGVMFAYIGAEIVTVAAAESANPSKEIRKASNSVVWRIILFYVGSMFVAVCLIPHNNELLKDSTWGTYSVTLSALGIPGARHIVNFVVLTSVCSCFNSALYTCSRMLFSLSKRGDAPKSFGSVNSKSSPWVGVIVSCFFSVIAVVLTATKSMDVYDFFMLTTGAATLYVYLTIAYSQLRMRKKLEAEGVKIDFKMWMFPYLTYLVIFAIIGAILTMLIEGTYFKEVIYTTALFGIIVFFGLLSEKLGWGKERRATHLTHSHEEKLV
ncbi:amino acid permease [Acinetobacter seifertii]|uniref:amino acid permease n=1 Tax=Acinetobacter TaxID=469 RepID=UPI000C1F4B52|nr:amino acid permease [Acinetobacter seifertii]PJF04241.1 GABA permease [Acinetobacter seifertii]PJG71369.1 GABA permease [Acinetobacter seifertii]